MAYTDIQINFVWMYLLSYIFPVNTYRYVFKLWDLSSAGRASALQAGGHRFEPCRSHLYMKMYNDKKGSTRQ